MGQKSAVVAYDELWTYCGARHGDKRIHQETGDAGVLPSLGVLALAPKIQYHPTLRIPLWDPH